MPTAVNMTDSTRLHVDELILDYLLWFCIESLLSERKLRQEGKVGKMEWVDASKSADMGLKLVNSFYQNFNHAHPNYILPNTINLRLRLCRFTTLFLRRLDVTSPTLAPSASGAAARTRAWLSRRRIPHVFAHPGADKSSHITGESEFGMSATPFSDDHLQNNQEEMRRQMGYYMLPESQRTLWGRAALKDALREFMVLSTWTSAIFAEVFTLWMRVAISFMLQAVLEAYRCHGANDLDAVNECFAWGLTEMDPLRESIEEVVINEMFAGDEGKVSLEFEALKNKALVEILPPPSVTLEAHFDRLAEENPWNKFEERVVIGFLSAMVSSQPSPILTQLENGKLDGFNDIDVQDLLATAGVDLR